jgi:hypothetical protein
MPTRRKNFQTGDSIHVLFDSVSDLQVAVAALKGKSVTVDVVSNNPLVEGDGQIWVDNTDNTFHFRCGGHEYKLSGTLVS